MSNNNISGLLFPEYREKDLSVLTFNLTWKCQVKCKYCYLANHISHDEVICLSKDKLIEECKVANKSHIKEYRFSGGEPITLGDKLFLFADIVFNLTNQKPVLLTSGYGINDKWLDKARSKFRSIAISIENPVSPLQTRVNNKRILDIIKHNLCDELPFSYGLTLITADYFREMPKIFDYLFEYSNGRLFPQFDYPCLRNYIEPTKSHLKDLRISTAIIFKKYGIIPYYFVYFIGSMNWLTNDLKRFVINLDPEGTYQVYNSLVESWQFSYRWQNYILGQHDRSPICTKCEWLDSCRYHPHRALKYDWCSIRKSIFEGIFEGLEMQNAN